MSKKAINDYYKELDKAQRFGGTKNEQSIKRPFIILLEKYFEPKNLYPVDELSLKNNKRPDGTIRDAFQIDWGYWENKDEKDNLQEEVAKKFKIGYPKFNIIFENTKEIILYQNGEKVMHGEMQNADFLHEILSQFVNFIIPEVQEFQKAIENFKTDIPEVLQILRDMIKNQAQSNKFFFEKRANFLKICKESINQEMTLFDVGEMLIQHILTDEIFSSIFNETHFHRENNISIELQKVIDTFFIGKIRRNTLASINTYYEVIKRKASHIQSHNEKQKFLKIVYENFYKAYNPKGADKLGIVYTPNEIVKFMVESTDILLEKHFNKNLSDKNVDILDPATGTGTFITEIIDYIPTQYLKYKYQNEIHANELAILPYYIANLNIEFTYQTKTGNYEPFENICWVDTLDNIGFSFKGKQAGFEGFGLSAENLQRIKRQNSKKISVIIGNPPYNANQQQENENNKNREYPQIDERIKNSYVKNSSAQKTKVYDMYSRFFRWASDRLNQDGVISFITNRSFIDSKTFDGFRKSLKKEFDYIYLIDLNGDLRANRKEATGNVFGIQTGVTIAFLIKKQVYDLHENAVEKNDAQIKYTSIFRFGEAKEKLEFLSQTKFNEIPFESIQPDFQNNWLNQTNNDFQKLLPLANKQTKYTNKKEEENAVFKLFHWGNSSNRDEWIYDFSEKELKKKIKYFIKSYNDEIKRWHKSDKTEKLDNFLHDKNLVKWSRDLKLKLKRKIKVKYQKDLIINALFRPFSKKYFYSEKDINDILTQNHYKTFGKNLQQQNKVICVTAHTQVPFIIFASDKLVDAGLGGRATHNIALYRYTSEGERIENITDWGLEQFQNHYEKRPDRFSKPVRSNITKEKIFYYVYAVLHNPAYRKKYEINLKRDFPRIPFYKDFDKWVNFGKKLMDLHLNYENVKPYELDIVPLKDLTGFENLSGLKPKLRLDKKTNDILIDENTTLKGVPEIAFEYKLGNRSAIEWILDQYKEKTPRDKTILEQFNDYRFADYKDEVIELIKKVCTVSVETMKIIKKMEKE